jgi:antitoxin PrlF
MKSVVSERGQVTIPKALREQLGIRPGAVLDFEEDHGRLIARKLAAIDPVDAVFGVLRLPRGTDAFLADLRGSAEA